jgi:hypothetical protein
MYLPKTAKATLPRNFPSADFCHDIIHGYLHAVFSAGSEAGRAHLLIFPVFSREKILILLFFFSPF